MISFHEIPHLSPAWREVLIHRDRISRRPLGINLSDEDTVNESSQRHFVLRDGSHIIAGLISCPPENKTIKLRQMWVHEDQQGNGMGSRLLTEISEQFAREGIERLRLHARVSVRSFYEKCGYLAEGRIFTEVGIPHIIMERQLTR
ncbi:GNAT family N-acetyltransferase [Haloferula chungangensis]|uniref:GNAT family N-acetyltransferase n=1 Tax=Haloferula chungangensis TaxID=1048331 RepID=A0ABW2LDF1_9BACT